MKYYKISEQKIINTVNEIPEEMLEKKGLLKYKRTIIKIPDTEDYSGEVGLIIGDICEEVIVEKYHIDTIEELKEKKISQLKSDCTRDILDKYPEYKQINAGLGIYDDETNSEIKQYIVNARSVLYEVLGLIEQCDTQESLDELYYKKTTYDEETLDMISTKYWGEK